MSSYNAIFEPMDNTSATERTPLLTTCVNPAVLDILGGSIKQTTSTDYESAGISHDNESFPVLGKAISNVSFGIAVETIPDLAGHPDDYGDSRQKHDSSGPRETDRGVDHSDETGFHGGISKRRFWIIFAGLSTISMMHVCLLIFESRYLDSQLCMQVPKSPENNFWLIISRWRLLIQPSWPQPIHPLPLLSIRRMQHHGFQPLSC